MGCGLDSGNTAEECAIDHWSPALLPLNAHRELNRKWRAYCHDPGCSAERSLEYDAPGRHVRWKSFCGHHDKEVVRPYLAKLIGVCMPSGRPRSVSRDELTELALADLSPQSLRLGLLELAGMPTAEALARLGIGPTHKRRVIDPLRRLGKLPVSVSLRSSAPLPVSVTPELPAPVSSRR